LADEREEHEDAFTEAHRELRISSIDLLVNVGIISSLMPRWPEDVQRNWVDEVQQMTEKLDDMIRTAQEFASALD
jgi:hypothetical protein